MSEKITMQDIQLALNIYHNNFDTIDNPELPIYLRSNRKSIEKEEIEKQELNSISSEAKTILKIIINSPSEIIGLFCPKRKTPSKNARKAVEVFIQQKGMNSNKIMRELKAFVHSDNFDIKKV